MKFINPNKLQVGDILLTTEMTPIAFITRRRTWRSENPFDLSLPTHAACICDRGDKIYYASEMAPRLKMSELEKYDHSKKSWFNHVVAVKRHPAMINSDDAYDLRKKANEFMIQVHSFKVKYGWDELLRYVGVHNTIDPYRMICSVWTRKIFDACEIVTPWKPDQIVTPADWYNWSALVNINIKP